jgi:mono/diheme cytochrome c family protein
MHYSGISFVRHSILTAACLATGGVGAWAAPAENLTAIAKPFLTEHCLDCHEAGTTKGGLNLEKVDFSLNGREQVDLWTRIFDRVSKGEMPPKKQPRPAAAELQKLLGGVRPRLLEADRAQREVTQRRLNRTEYENTIHDLLYVDVDLQHFIPEDQLAGGFDNNGDALTLSPDHLQGYLEAARAAVDAAIILGPQPKTETGTASSLSEVQKLIDSGDYGYVDGRIVLHTTGGDSTYSKLSTRAKRTTVRGRYRFEFQAAAHNTKELQFFTVNASNFAGVAASMQNLGYYEVGPEPKKFTIETVVGAKSAVQLFALGLPGYIKKTPGATYPGVGFGEITVTGPLIEQWPPPSHAQLFGDLNLQTATAADAKAVLQRFMPRAFRRPVTEAEVERYVSLVKKGMESGRKFPEAIRTSLVAVLCSPHFLYLREEVRPNTKRISDYELAARLSYFLWSTMPDADLLGLAEKQQLSDPKVLHAQVDRMLKDKRSEALVANFTGQWLRLRQINDTTPDKKLYKKFDELLEMSMVREGQAFFRQMIAEDRPLKEFIDSDWAMLNQRLADHYGIPGVSGLDIRKVALPKDCIRGGVLTQAGLLKVTANGTTTSPVLRGVWVLENILGQHVPPPPPNAGSIEPDIRGATTVRELLEKHRSNESCQVCHEKIDPPGFALESFDPIGDQREKYLRWNVTNAEKGWGNVQPGAAVDASGNLATGEKFGDIREFKKLLLQRSDAFSACLTEKLLTYGLGREMGFSDRPVIENIVRQSAAGGNGLRRLIHAIVGSEIFANR